LFYLTFLLFFHVLAAILNQNKLGDGPLKTQLKCYLIEKVILKEVHEVAKKLNILKLFFFYICLSENCIQKLNMKFLVKIVRT